MAYYFNCYDSSLIINVVDLLYLKDKPYTIYYSLMFYKNNNE